MTTGNDTKANYNIPDPEKPSKEHREIYKTCCSDCPSCQNPEEDPEMMQIRQYNKHLIIEEFLFVCYKRQKKLCKGLCDFMGISQEDIDNHFENRSVLYVQCSVDGCSSHDKLFVFDEENEKQMRRKLLGRLARKGWTCDAGGQMFFCPDHSDKNTKLLHSKTNPKPQPKLILPCQEKTT